MSDWTTIEGWEVRRVTEKAIALVKEGVGPLAELTWVPRSMCLDGDELAIGDTDIVVRSGIAVEKGLAE